MTENILFLAHVDESGTALPKAAYEALSAALELKEQLGSTLTIGLVGENIAAAADSLAEVGARIVGVSGSDFAHPRYASDATAVEAICRAAAVDVVIAPGTSRFMRVIPGVAQRVKGCVDTHLTSIQVAEGVVNAKRWFYRQRLEGHIQRDARPWFLLVDSGCYPEWSGAARSGVPKIENLPSENLEVTLPAENKRTTFGGIRTPGSDAQTIRPDAKLLFVAGAGWCKKQADGKTHLSEAESLILEFLRESGASLGGSKSLVDQTGENQAVLRFMTHLNQVGQTGSTPRHPKGLSTCCHGEEPHAVGWRFIKERRAVNLDPNCGWARGKADVLYVGDAFQVMAKLSARLKQRAGLEEVAESAVAR
jgi:electron transfer flavoprotein alpha subunit